MITTVKVIRPAAGTTYCYRCGVYSVPDQMPEAVAKDLVRGGHALDISARSETPEQNRHTEKRNKRQ